MARFVEDSTSQYVEDFQKTKRAINALVSSALNDFMLESSTDDETESSNASAISASTMDELEVFKQVERKPEIQFGLNGRNLDSIYSGRSVEKFGRLLWVHIFGVDGLSSEMISPTKVIESGRASAPMEKVVTFLRKLELNSREKFK